MTGTVEKHDCIDVQELNRLCAFTVSRVIFPNIVFRLPWLSMLKSDRWSMELEFRNGRKQAIYMLWTRCHFGGERPWFRCPACSQRVGKLYDAGSFCACRECCNLRYASQRRASKSRKFLQVCKLRLQLGGMASINEPFHERPHRMHVKTFVRLRQRGEELEAWLRKSKHFRRKKPEYPLLCQMI